MSQERQKVLKFINRELKLAKLPRQVVDEITHIIESSFKQYPELSEEQPALGEILKVVKEQDRRDSTDIHLLVSQPASEVASGWDRQKIIDALIREVGISLEEAEEIAFAVERKVFGSDMKIITVSLIRELVNNELFERGYERKLKRQEILGISVYNLTQLITSKTDENSNITANNPEAVNLAIAETTLKQYALSNVFSEDIAEAHLKGAIHLHDLGYPVRVYCSAHSLEYLKKYGLELVNLDTVSKPAAHPQTLVGHLNTFLASMQAYYAGALGISYINIFLAPLVEGMSFKDMRQLAQYMIFSSSQNAFSRGGQTLFIDFNVHLGIPRYLKEVPAIGPRGRYNGKTYGDYEETAQKFLKAMMSVWEEGDAEGQPFAFPKMDLHINEESFKDERQLELLRYACRIASKNGAPYFIFDRDSVTLSACCRLRTHIKDDYVLKHPESLRFCGFQNVTINLPQCAYRAGRRAGMKIKGRIFDLTLEEIYKTMDLAMRAHLQKKKFIESLMSAPGLPLWQLGQEAADGRPYVDLDREDTSYIIGMLGLNEAVKYITGKALHEDEGAYRTGLKLISAMYLRAKEYEKEYNLNVKLEETPAESTSLRLAKVDLTEYPESASFVRGNKEKGEVYYTNSIHLEPDAPVDLIQRIEMQGRFHQLIEAGAITHAFVGEKLPDPESVFNLVLRTWQNTPTAQITISPEFTVCQDCRKVSVGYAR